ncbi:MAG: hypothetical protein ACRD1T_15330, partial [Acidimicrobiia bacterium]
MMSKQSQRDPDRLPAGIEAWAQVRAAATDTTWGAERIATLAATALSVLGRSRKDLEEALSLLLDGHPGMAPLWRLAEACLSADEPAAEALRWQARLEDEYLQAARRAAGVIGSNLPRGATG